MIRDDKIVEGKSISYVLKEMCAEENERQAKKRRRTTEKKPRSNNHEQATKQKHMHTDTHTYISTFIRPICYHRMYINLSRKISMCA